ncbi:Oidioi.mRNA.OKI2018_I69.chr1.g1430.t2.cds [Oikopleura dioica]|uniref:Oidioi.mRNA.OKI2018_I69.chr1.g1430.t2.cds n=1 Tax=Oikopleura dioica TaxID=34765 RepID=A0ABN7SSY2_OIKDI|nr:Oidioi.mRNA.OKI2018_I69.chr1.g1430.t2.cds [Oikopleura dioica]
MLSVFSSPSPERDDSTVSPVKSASEILSQTDCPEYFQLDIMLSRGENLKAMDSNGFSDPYTTFLIGPESLCKSEIKKRTLNPLWNQFFQVRITAEQVEKLRIEVKDRDTFSSDDLIGCNAMDLRRLNMDEENTIKMGLRGGYQEDEDASLGTIYFTIKLRNFCGDAASSGSKSNGKTKKKKITVANAIIQIRDVFDVKQFNKELPSIHLKAKLEGQKYETKTKRKCLNPVFNRACYFTLMQEPNVMHKDHSLQIDMFDSKTLTASGTIKLTSLAHDTLHNTSLDLRNEAGKLRGRVNLAITISGVDAAATHEMEEKFKLASSGKIYNLSRTLSDFTDIGILKVVLHSAANLKALDGAFGFGTSDPYCYVDLGNQRFRTATIDKTVNPEWNRTFYFEMADLYECLTLSIYDEDQNEDDFLGRLCLPIADMINDKKMEYRLKTKRLDSFTQGTLTVTCTRYYNPIRGNARLFKPKAKTYWNCEPKYNMDSFFANVNRLKAFEMPDIAPLLALMHDVIHWKNKPLSFLIWIGTMAAVHSFEPWMIPAALVGVLVVGRIQPSLFVKKKNSSKKSSISGEKDKSGKKSEDAINQNFIKKTQEMIKSVERKIDFIAGILEKIFHTFIWIRPAATFTLVFALIIITIVLKYIGFRVILMLWLTKKLTIYGIKPNYQDNNEILDFLSRIPTIPDLYKYKAEVFLHDDSDEETDNSPQ